MTEMADNPQHIKVDVTSDYLCPFCLLGMRQLEMAIEKYQKQYPGFKVDVHMHPFQLNGTITETPIDRREWGESRFGAERWAALGESMRQKFADVGIEVPKANTFMSSSHLAHRLTQYAHEVAPQQEVEVAMDLFKLYHADGVHLSDRDALSKVAVKNGLFTTTDEARTWLDGTGCCLEVKKGYQRAQRSGITGVPFFVFQDKYAASGAMGVDEFVDILGEIVKRSKSASPPPMAVSGEQCVV